MLEGFSSWFPPEMREPLLVGLEEPDDAAVYRLDAETALIFTADYFPPVVDDPRAYGTIAATNALNDVYAMGGRPMLALNLAIFPDDMPQEVARAILRGAAEKAREAGAVIAGGHTTQGEEPTFGLAVIGRVSPGAVMRKGGARPGDRVFLTKPLGSGVVTTAGKRGLASASDIEAAVASMSRLNVAGAEVARAVGAHAATDVTGFGLAGHALEMANEGRVRFHIHPWHAPLLPGVVDYARAGCFPGGANHNEAYFGSQVVLNGDLDELRRRLLFSPETAGGLLLAIPTETAETFRASCRSVGQPAWEIGEVVAGQGLEITGSA